MELIKILLIDDEQSIYDIVSHYCKKNSEYSIELEWYDEVPKDISHVNLNNFSLLLLDYHIHQHTGIEVLQMLNENWNGETVSLPVIMLSNSDDIQVAARAIHYGISDFIPKGNITADLLNNTINSVVFKNNLKLQLIDSNKKLEASNHMLVQKNEEISNFYQVISHELKTPLTSTSEFISIMLDGIAGELTDDQREYLSICHRNCKQLTQYINDLLDIGRISTGKYKLNKATVDVNAIIVEAINTSKILAERRNIKITFEMIEEELFIDADEVRVYQALLILISNAIKFSPVGECINISMEVNVEKHFIEISVIDNGCGIATEHHEKIFERLYQTNTYEVGSNAGLGLGLFICKVIMQLHEGEISVESTPGKGSRFRLKFPYNSNTSRMPNEKNTHS